MTVHVKAVDHRANRILAALPSEDFARIEPHLEIVNLPTGKVLFEAGQAVNYTYLPHDCVVSLVAVLADGSTAEVAMFGREGMLGLISALVTRESFGRYVVQVPGTCSRIAVDKLQQVFDSSPACKILLRRYVEALLAQTFQTVACNALHGVEARCCRWILTTQDRVDRDTLLLTHEFLAAMLGVQRPTVSLVTRKLHAAGLIRQGRGVITVMDRAGLQKFSCECYATIRHNFQRLLPGTYAHANRRLRAEVVG